MDSKKKPQPQVPRKRLPPSISSEEMRRRIEHPAVPLPPEGVKKFDPEKGEYLDESNTQDPTWLQ